MGSLPTSRLRFLDPSGAPIDSPTEWAPALVEALIPPNDWEKVKFYRQDAHLPVYLKSLGGQVRVLADWPRSGPGHYQLRFDLAGEAEERVLTVRPQKINAEAYAQLLDDLRARLPAEVAVGLQRAGALVGVNLLPTSETTLGEELVRLRRAVLGVAGRPGLPKVLTELARDPYQVLRTAEVWVPRERARRPHPSRLAQAIWRPHNLELNGRTKRVPDTRVEHTTDVYENRLVKAYWYQVDLRIRRLLPALEALQHISNLEEARGLGKQLIAARQRAGFLDRVTLPVHPPTRLTMVLLKRPPYRAALEGYIEFHKSAGVRFEEAALDAPLQNLPYLYEVWGTLEIISALLEVASELGYQVAKERLANRHAGGIYIRVLPDGEPAIVLIHPTQRTSVSLIPKRTYGKSGQLHSVSYGQIPDVAVQVHPSHDPARVYLFDPKYKLEGELLEGDTTDGKPKKVDIDKMHAYRDAIRDEVDRRAVQYAAILYPGPDVQYAEGIEALSGYPGLGNFLGNRLRNLFREWLSATIV